MITNLPIEINQIIMDMLDFRSQINFKYTFRNHLYITNFNVPLILSSIITEEILKNHPRIEHLNLYDNKLVSDISFLTHITSLNISGSCIIGQEQITHLVNLRELDVSNNVKVKTLVCFKKLKELIMDGICNISKEECQKLTQLTKLQCKYNPLFDNLN